MVYLDWIFNMLWLGIVGFKMGFKVLKILIGWLVNQPYLELIYRFICSTVLRFAKTTKHGVWYNNKMDLIAHLLNEDKGWVWLIFIIRRWPPSFHCLSLTCSSAVNVSQKRDKMRIHLCKQCPNYSTHYLPTQQQNDLLPCFM